LEYRNIGVSLDTYLGNVEQNDARKTYRAKTPRTQRKKYFSELGALCVFARGIPFRFRNQNSTDNFKYLWLKIRNPLLHHSNTPTHHYVFVGGRSTKLRTADVINAQPKMAKERP